MKVFLVWLTDMFEKDRELIIITDDIEYAREQVLKSITEDNKIVIEEAYLNEVDSGSKFEVYDYISGLEYINEESEVDHPDIATYDLIHRKIISLNKKFQGKKVKFKNDDEIKEGVVESIYHFNDDDRMYAEIDVDGESITIYLERLI